MKPAHRNIIHRHARLRSGAGVHKDKFSFEPTTEHDMELTLKEFREEHGIFSGTDFQEALTDWSVESVVPALCKEGCEVAPDGFCEHNCPSILVRMGVI